MTAFSRRRGSALLIVLGFLSFMVVSAVAFAVFMRAERAPSSALRRGIATRHLVKAALARAIGDVDDAVRNDVFPGLPGSGNGGVYYHDVNNNAHDVWQGRVFMPPDPEGSTLDVNTRFAPIGETVSVLNLEALGYLPPALVNDVRFLSRCSWTARWRNFPYDAGRYAYTAVNVSDYFDINLLRANRGRFSTDDGRITLAPCFKGSSGDVDASAASAFDAFVHENRVAGGAASTMPYVSLLDYNLALGARHGKAGFGSGYNSPFWSWINNPSYEIFYQSFDTNENSNVAYAKRQAFVTDSWFPSAAATAADEQTNLLYEAGQPWSTTQDALMRNSADAPIVDVVGKSTRFKQIMQTENQYLNLADYVTLFDYLDPDDLPLSLAQPCVERVPMAAALEPALSYQFKTRVESVVSTVPATPTPGQPYQQITTTTLKFNAASFPSVAGLRAVFAFPFKYGRALNAGATFKAQAMLRLALVMSADPAQQVGLRAATDSALANLRPKNGEWASATAFATQRGGQGAVVTYLGRERTLSFPSQVSDEADAFMDNGATVFSDLAFQGTPDVVFAQRTETVQMSAAGVAQGNPQVAWTFPDGVRPFAADGSALPDVADASYDSYVIRPYVAMWVKVANNDGVVDYVPAMLDDDAELGGVNNSASAALDSRLNFGDAAGTPLLRAMDTSAPLSLQTVLAAAMPGGNDYTAPAAATWEPRAFFTVDPRYNWAPEDWLPKSASATRDAWLDSLQNVLGQNGCAPDIFMAASNQGYLQSMGELAMLPRLTDGSGAAISVTYNGAVRATDCDWTEIAHKDTAWRTYAADYELAAADRASDGLFNMGIVADGTGFRVNPYTDNAQILQAAFSLTPCDWWAAGTNVNASGNATSASLKRQMLTSLDRALDHAFCEQNTEARLAAEDVARITQFFMNRFQANPNRKWEDVYDDAWNEYAGEAAQDPALFFGQQLRNGLLLHAADRKFLYAYWRGCFANKQQLFLIFVRAESNALGGPGEGTPSQQGGRAVALVWRDPNQSATATDYQDTNQTYVDGRRPHRTRVLFYHQFD